MRRGDGELLHVLARASMRMSIFHHQTGFPPAPWPAPSCQRRWGPGRGRSRWGGSHPRCRPGPEDGVWITGAPRVLLAHHPLMQSVPWQPSQLFRSSIPPVGHRDAGSSASPQCGRFPLRSPCCAGRLPAPAGFPAPRCLPAPAAGGAAPRISAGRPGPGHAALGQAICALICSISS